MAKIGVSMEIGPHTKYILSTSGRLSSLNRYQKLLQVILKLDIAYVPLHSGIKDRPAIDPARFAASLRGMPCIGGAISRDIKNAIIPYLDEIDASAVAVQSVNTVIVKEGGKLKGYNTDVIGFKHAIEKGLEESQIEVRSAVCYGYGGVTSVVVSVLQAMNIEVFVTGRDPEKIEQRAQELGIKAWREDQATPVDLFVNASPASEYPLDRTVNFVEALQTCKLAFDHEMPGKCLKEYCAENAVYLIEGTSMYYPQMYAQWELFLEGIVDREDIPVLIAEANK